MTPARPLYDFALLDAPDYLAELVKEAKGAKERIYITCPLLTNEAVMIPLLTALREAAERGIEVNIAADVYTYGELSGYATPFKRALPAARSMTQVAARLEQAGANFVWLGANLRKFNPFSGVTHIKWSVVDDIVYAFGGTNLYKGGIESADYMFRITHKALADELVLRQHSIIEQDSSFIEHPDVSVSYPFGTLLIDNGMRNSSIIYERVCDLADQAEEVLVVTQFCPTGKLAKSLRTRTSQVYFNNPRFAPKKIGTMVLSDQIRTGLRTRYTHKKYLHAKFAIFTMADGSKKAVTGSHNFSYYGVRFGTREVALETSDATIIRQLEDFFERHIK